MSSVFLGKKAYTKDTKVFLITSCLEKKTKDLVFCYQQSFSYEIFLEAIESSLVKIKEKQDHETTEVHEKKFNKKRSFLGLIIELNEQLKLDNFTHLNRKVDHPKTYSIKKLA